MSTDVVETKVDTRVPCLGCDGTGWSRSGRGRCLSCKGVALVEPRAPGETGPSTSPIPSLAEHESVVYHDVKPPHIGRAVLVAQRDVRALGGAQRTSQMADGSSYSSAEEILSLGGDALLALGVTSCVDHVEPLLDGTGQPRLAVTLRLEHPESGEVWERVEHVAVSPPDREHTLAQAEFAAATSAHAYFLVRVLAMPRGYRGESALSKERPDEGPTVLVKPEPTKQSDAATVLLADVAAAKTEAEMLAVQAKFLLAVKKRQLRGEVEQKRVGEAIGERMLVCKANDAHRAAEGEQRGRAA